MTLTKEAKKLAANDHNYNSDLEDVIRQVKEEFKSIFAKRRDLIIKLGEAFECTVSNSESICEEIKNELNDEIAQGLISRRDIERYCPEKWKKKTRPKKEENDKLSFSKQEEEAVPILIKVHGDSAAEQAAIPAFNSNNSDAIDSEGSTKEGPNYTGEFPADNAFEQESKSIENNKAQYQVEELKSEPKSRAPNLNQKDRFFDTKFELPFESLQNRMMTLLSKNNHIKSISFIAKVDLQRV